MLKHGAKICQTDINGENALHYAAKSSTAMIEMLFNGALLSFFI